MMEGSSSCSNPGEELPYKSLVHFYAPNIVTMKLSGPETYDVWKTQMLCLLESHDMLGFITPAQKSVSGKKRYDVRSVRKTQSMPCVLESHDMLSFIKPVEKSVSGKERYDVRSVRKTQSMPCVLESHDDMLGFITPEEKSVSGKEKVEDLDEASTSIDAPVKGKDDDYKNDKLWRRSDALVKGWLFGSLTEQPLKQVVNFFKTNNDFTSRDVWDKLQTIYGPAAPLPQVKLNQETERLYEATLNEDFDRIEKILSRGLVTLRDKITINGDTALHVAVGTTKNEEFLDKLFQRAKIGDQQPLDMRNSEGRNLLHVAAIVGNMEAVWILFFNEGDLFYEKDNEGHMALDIALYDKNTYYNLLKLCKDYTEMFVSRLRKPTFNTLLSHMISSKEYRLALDYIMMGPRLMDLGETPLMNLAQHFPPKQVNFWERIFPKLLVKYFNHDAELTSYEAAKKLLVIFCDVIRSEPSYHNRYFNNAILEAIRQDAYKFVKISVCKLPNAIWSANEEGHNIIQYAVINRSEKTYNLLYQMSEHKNYYKTIKDHFGNNLLHLAARLAPTEKLDPISGAALQIQYELQWFKEVEGFISQANITQKNLFDETPQMAFTREHKELLIDGEKWMKATAESYTITAALITTVVFAAAITVPGGNKQDNGIPMFTNKTAFTIFAISDAISLFTSVTSLLIFLSILTARFAEQDFLFKFPTKLIIGLVALFISTTAMLVAFGATLFLVFGQDNSIILVPIAALTCLPITCFVTLQFPLVYDLMSETYGRSIFGKKRIQLIYDRLNAICGRNIFGKKTKRPFY